MEIKFAQLHGMLWVPGEGQFGPKLIKDGPDRSKDFKMSWDGETLTILTPGTKTQKPQTVLVPRTNISHIIPVDEKNN